jgi:hypothetical protein
MVSMNDETRLAACSVIELAVRQIADPDRTQEHRDELAVVLKDRDAQFVQFVALEIATTLAGVAVGHLASDCCDIKLGSIIEEIRARVVRGE